MDLQPVDRLLWEDDTSTLTTPEGEIVNVAPGSGPDLAQPPSDPPVPGFAWFYTMTNDRVPVLLSGIPDAVWRYMSPAQMNAADLGQRVPVPPALKATGGLALLLGLGIVWYLWKNNSR